MIVTVASDAAALEIAKSRTRLRHSDGSWRDFELVATVPNRVG
jgi:hypothetical protein